MKTICPDDIIVRYIHFPAPTIHEAVSPNIDGTYSIYIEKNLSHNMQREVFKHAMRHILNNDFEKADVQEIEAVAHGITQVEPVRVRDDAELLKMMSRVIKWHRKIKRELVKHEQMLGLLTDAEREKLVWTER